MSYPINEVCSQFDFHLEGNIIPQSWMKHITNERGRVDVNAVLLLAEIVYWYRPTCKRDPKTGEERWEKKFAADIWQQGYADLEEKLGLTKKQLSEAFMVLESHKLAFREFRTITVNGTKMSNVLFVRPDPQKIKEITYRELKKVVSYRQICAEGSTNLSIAPPEFVDTYTETPSETSTQTPSFSKEPLPKKKKIMADKKIRLERDGITIETSDQEHKELLEKYGEAPVAECYAALLEWKSSKAHTDPKSLGKHTDRYRISDWVAKKVAEKKSSPNNSGITIPVSSREFAQKLKTSPELADKLEICPTHIEIRWTPTDSHPFILGFEEKGFHERVIIYLARRNVKINF